MHQLCPRVLIPPPRAQFVEATGNKDFEAAISLADQSNACVRAPVVWAWLLTMALPVLEIEPRNKLINKYVPVLEAMRAQGRCGNGT